MTVTVTVNLKTRSHEDMEFTVNSLDELLAKLKRKYKTMTSFVIVGCV